MFYCEECAKKNSWMWEAWMTTQECTCGSCAKITVCTFLPDEMLKKSEPKVMVLDSLPPREAPPMMPRPTEVVMLPMERELEAEDAKQLDNPIPVSVLSKSVRRRMDIMKKAVAEPKKNVKKPVKKVAKKIVKKTTKKPVKKSKR